MLKQNLSLYTRIMLGLAAACLSLSIWAVIWRIELEAPQYPEGLALLIYANHLGGDVDIINGLNHYIGMQTLHTEDFPEFKVLPYLIGAFSFFTLITALLNKRIWLNVLFVCFLLFGIIAMADFYRWNYNYGHHLDPNAAIKVPGMAYQPPLIGFKQLLNFGAYSIPDIGGWMFITAGGIMLTAVLLENKWLRSKQVKLLFVLSGLITITGCSQSGPEPINLNKDQCEFCKMTITDARFACETITSKGRTYKFDDLYCMKRNVAVLKDPNAQYYVSNYKQPNQFLSINNTTLIKSSLIKSPMGGNTAAFSSQQDAQEYITSFKATMVTW